MASRALLISTIVLGLIAGPGLAMDYMVGDEAGWALGVNYTKWAQGKDFRVGDTIMFMYTPGTHNVLKVDQDDFKACTSSNASIVPMTSGNDTINLTTSGKKWYICDVDNHCKNGMKLVITVLSSSGIEGPAPAPQPGSTPTSAACKSSPIRTSGWMLAMVVAGLQYHHSLTQHH